MRSKKVRQKEWKVKYEKLKINLKPYRFLVEGSKEVKEGGIKAGVLRTPLSLSISLKLADTLSSDLYLIICVLDMMGLFHRTFFTRFTF